MEPLESGLQLFREDFLRHIDERGVPGRPACGRRRTRGSTGWRPSTWRTSRTRCPTGRTCWPPVWPWASICPSSAGIPAMGSVGACRQCAVKQFKDENDREGKIVMACVTPADRRHAHLHRRPRGPGLPRGSDRVADGQPPPRLSGVRRGRRVPPPGHDRHDRPLGAPLPFSQAHLPQPGPGALRQPRDEPLHPVLPLRALLRGLRRRRRSRGHGHPQPRCTSAGTRTASWRASSAGTSWRSAPPASSPTRPSRRHYTRKWDLQTAPSICPHCGLGCNTIPGERYGCCAASTAATTAPSTATSSATEAALATSSSTPTVACGRSA